MWARTFKITMVCFMHYKLWRVVQPHVARWNEKIVTYLEQCSLIIQILPLGKKSPFSEEMKMTGTVLATM